MYRGLMIRHLVMPNNIGGSKEVVRWIAENLPKDTYLNIMSQYRPMYKALDYPKIARRINREEFEEVVACARNQGLTNLDIQGFLDGSNLPAGQSSEYLVRDSGTDAHAPASRHPGDSGSTPAR